MRRCTHRDNTILIMWLNCIVASSNRPMHIYANYPISITPLPHPLAYLLMLTGSGYRTYICSFFLHCFIGIRLNCPCWIWGMQKPSLTLPQSCAFRSGYDDTSQVGSFTSSLLTDLLWDTRGNAHYSDAAATGFHSGPTQQSTPVLDLYLNRRNTCYQLQSNPPSKNPSLWSPFN
jgi:hypothetical protein